MVSALCWEMGGLLEKSLATHVHQLRCHLKLAGESEGQDPPGGALPPLHIPVSPLRALGFLEVFVADSTTRCQGHLRRQFCSTAVSASDDYGKYLDRRRQCGDHKCENTVDNGPPGSAH